MQIHWAHIHSKQPLEFSFPERKSVGIGPLRGPFTSPAVLGGSAECRRAEPTKLLSKAAAAIKSKGRRRMNQPFSPLSPVVRHGFSHHIVPVDCVFISPPSLQTQCFELLRMVSVFTISIFMICIFQQKLGQQKYATQR